MRVTQIRGSRMSLNIGRGSRAVSRDFFGAGLRGCYDCGTVLGMTLYGRHFMASVLLLTRHWFNSSRVLFYKYVQNLCVV